MDPEFVDALERMISQSTITMPVGALNKCRLATTSFERQGGTTKCVLHCDSNVAESSYTYDGDIPNPTDPVQTGSSEAVLSTLDVQFTKEFNDNSHIFECDEKSMSRSKYEKGKGQNGRRNNVKETKRRQWKKYQPHSDEEPTIILDAKTLERNRLAHIVNDTPATTRPPASDTLDSILETVREAPSLFGEERNADLDEWVGHLENLAILGYQMNRASNFTDIFVAITAYAKMYIKNRSLILDLYKLIDELSSCPEDEVEPQSWTGRDAMDKWNLFKTNTIFTKISYLITAAMSLSVCNVKNIEWSPMGLKLISLEAATKQLEAVDLIDALIGTFVWIAEVGHRVIEEKSLTPLLYSDANVEKFNTDCDEILATAESVLAGNGGDINDFENKLDKVTQRVCELKTARANGSISIWLQQKYSELVNIKQKVIAKRKNTALRFAPIGWALSGPTAVGKSTLAKLTMKTSLNAMGFSADPDRIMTRDMFDKYDSTFTSDIQGVFLDDVGNGRSDFAEESITSIIIKFFNNVAAQAVKAELNLKGITFIDFKCGVLTANMEGFDATSYTNCKESIHRRFYHVSVKIKEKYRLKGSVSINPYHEDLVDAELTHDIWQLDIKECHVYEKKLGETDSRFVPITVELDGKPVLCENIDLYTYLRVVILLSERHAASQISVLKRSKCFDEMNMCLLCKMPCSMCRCPKDDKESVSPDSLENVGDIIVNAATKSVKNYVQSWFGPVQLFNSMMGFAPIKNMATTSLAKEISHTLNENGTPLAVAITPEWVFRTSLFKRSMNYWQHSSALYNVKPRMKMLSIATTLGVGFGFLRGDKRIIGASLGISWIGGLGLYCNYTNRVKQYKKEYLERRDALTVSCKSIRDGPVPKGVFVVTTLIIGLKLMKMWNNQRVKGISPDGLCKESIDGQPGWFGHMMQKMGVASTTQSVSKSAETSHVAAALDKVQFYASFTRADGSKTRCNIIFPRKCVAWIPLHIFYPGANMEKEPTSLLNVEVQRFKGKTGIFSFKCQLDQCVIMDDLDMVAVYVPNCFDTRDIMKWLPLTKPKGVAQALLQVKTESIERRNRYVSVECGAKGHKYKNFYGGSYTTDLAQTGACMSPLIADRKEPFILGFHIGGNAQLQFGVMQSVTLDQARKSLILLEQKPGVILSAQSVDLPRTQYDEELIDSPEVHPHSMASKIGDYASVDIFGSTRLRTQQKSAVKQSMISDSVLKHTNVPNTWEGPKLNPNWKGFNATLEYVIDPADMFDPALLERARQDWLGELKPLMLKHCREESVRPLTEKESVLGQPGVRFMDAIPMDTGMGFPLFGPKRNHFDEIRDGQTLIDRRPSPRVKTEMVRLMDCWERGERGYPVTTATLKDAPTEIGVEKVRVYQAVAVAFGLHIRKYFLPIARFLHLHPLEAESAVGINAFSPQWEVLMNHAHKFAEDDKVIAWDYSKYDVRMSSQMTRAALLSYIELAQLGQYSEHDIYIMKMMVTDLVHPLMDWNGTLLMTYNMNTSGNNLTVDINSTCGALYVRMGLFQAAPEVKRFKDVVSVSTYGDDLTGSVREDYRNKFNFIVFKEFLTLHKMKVTLPDKSDDVSLFMDKGDADFLKRKTNYISKIGCGLGKLDENSIFKSLHSNLLSRSATPREVATSCIETALHEWFAFGEEHYELRRSQMRLVCDEMDLPIVAVNFTFDDRVESWKEKYSSTL